MDIPQQTPLYHAINKGWYARQQLIRAIQDETKRDLIVYVTNIQGTSNGIDKSDVLAFGDLLHDKKDKDLDLLLQSPGGDVDVAEKIVYMCRNNTKSLRVIVAESAKSAATLIALAADSILMGYTAELGPIDPQVTVTTATGEALSRPAQSYLDGLKAIQEEVKRTGQLSPVYFPLLQQLDPALIDYCKKAIQRTQRFAEKWLLRYQCEGEPKKAKGIAKSLVDPRRYLSHGTVIDHKEASEELKLRVEFLPPEDKLWQAIWRLYCTYEIDMRTEQLIKMFESATVSIPVK